MARTVRPKANETPSSPIPFLVGGRSDAALERAGRLADGWLATWCSPTRFGQAIGLVEGRDRVPDGGWRHAVQLWVGVGESQAEGRTHVAAGMERFYKIPFERFEKSLGDRSEDVRQRFYADNFVDLMGTAVTTLV